MMIILITRSALVYVFFWNESSVLASLVICYYYAVRFFCFITQTDKTNLGVL